ncbi:hypothetical protein GCM10011578_097770 [Streptomyces fuscichromogenes]|uniref:Novel STAND NTPase 5 domain-containing protein n=1 Tax=Streptomyces fuscichromogenes TaxID=1324013 RepID=A0A918CXH7_9ACTN|nr:ATP-binding protein [Streptomyces fuscichromogenes]GGN45623.1 hypothetical protein GCM10011578_097770 [Streptomyces fuscichromogenes]
MLHVHGPVGIGKSTLLRRFAIEAMESGRTVVAVDASHIEPTKEAFSRAASLSELQRPVLLVDSVDAVSHLEEWIKDCYLPAAPRGALVVLAGWRAPPPKWLADLVWTDVTDVVELAGLSAEESTTLLEQMKVSGSGRNFRASFADGHPLALRLSAWDKADDAALHDEWQPSLFVIDHLMRQLVGRLPTPAHRRALEICAHTLDTTEDLLRAVIPEHAEETFAWLRELPCIMAGDYGLRPITVVAEAVDRDLKWRAPHAYLAMHETMRVYVRGLVDSPSHSMALRAASALLYMQTRGRWHLNGFQEKIHETRYAAADGRDVRRLACEMFGESAGELVDFWVTRQPQSFVVYRSAVNGEVLGFQCLLRFDRWDAAEVLIDPVLAALQNHGEGTGLRSGEPFHLVRFMVTREEHSQSSAVETRMLARVTLAALKSDISEFIRLFIALEADSSLLPLLRLVDFREIAVIPGEQRPTALLGLDWRAVTVADWIKLLDRRMLFGSQVPTRRYTTHVEALSRAVFDDAVHDALRSWHQREQFTANPLLKVRLVAALPPGERDQALRELIVRAIEAIDEDPKARGVRAVVWSTYVVGGGTQQAVARNLSMSFSTYRRYLKRGLAKIAWYLWQYEMASASEAG